MDTKMKFPEKYRIAGNKGESGAFKIEMNGRVIGIIASDGLGWDHVSVSLANRCPNWREMCYVKSLFWDDEQAVMQIHVPKSQHINIHEFCLHMWRPHGIEIPLPPTIMV